MQNLKNVKEKHHKNKIKANKSGRELGTVQNAKNANSNAGKNVFSRKGLDHERKLP